MSFLENRAWTLESSNHCATLTSKRQGNQKGNFKTSKSVSALHSTVNRPNSGRQSQDSRLCFLCKQPHFLAYCPTFTELSDNKKLSYVVESKICQNCMRSGHLVAECLSKGRCRTANCQGRHHTHLHGALAHTDRSASGNLIPRRRTTLFRPTLRMWTSVINPLNQITQNYLLPLKCFSSLRLEPVSR